LPSILAYDIAVIAFVPGLAGQHLDFLQQKFGFIKNNPPELIKDISRGRQDILGLHTISLGLSLLGLLVYACARPYEIHSVVLVLFVLFFIFRLHEIDEFTRKQEELDFYHQELEKLQLKMNYIRVEMDLTNRIIDMIENEKITDLRDWLKPESAKR
jgi:hypothetical protein